MSEKREKNNVSYNTCTGRCFPSAFLIEPGFFFWSEFTMKTLYNSYIKSKMIINVSSNWNVKNRTHRKNTIAAKKMINQSTILHAVQKLLHWNLITSSWRHDVVSVVFVIRLSNFRELYKENRLRYLRNINRFKTGKF